MDVSYIQNDINVGQKLAGKKLDQGSRRMWNGTQPGLLEPPHHPARPQKQQGVRKTSVLASWNFLTEVRFLYSGSFYNTRQKATAAFGNGKWGVCVFGF